MAHRLSSLRIIIFSIALISPTLSSATTYFQPTSISQFVIYAGKSGSTGAFVVFSPAIPGLEGCSAGGGSRVWIDFSSTALPDGKSLYATLMAGVLSGKALAFDVNGCDPVQNLPLVFRIDVFP